MTTVHQWQHPVYSRRWLALNLMDHDPFHTGEVHTMDTSRSPAHATYEMMGLVIDVHIPLTTPDTINLIRPNMPWAEEHFGERVSGIAHNPAPSHIRWPWARHNAQHQDMATKFSHTYPERMWPKFANEGETRPNGRQVFVPHNGIRYEYGDTMDVVNLLVRNRYTRQAFLPIWFPEDTGNAMHERVPCSIGYHFMVRGDELHCWYTLRSCDAVRHLPDDLYMACRLTQWMADMVNDGVEKMVFDKNPGVTNLASPYPSLRPGILHTSISSLHAFVGDKYTLRRWVNGE